MSDTQPVHSDAARSLYLAEYGSEGPTLLLLHGMGATGAVWDRLRSELEPGRFGRVLVPDLGGHGRSPRSRDYSFRSLAAQVGVTVGGTAARRVTILGHSLGGAVALELASGRYGFEPEAVHVLGMKVDWSESELATMGALASRPPRRFPNRKEAAIWFLKLAGLHGLLNPEENPRLVDSGVVVDGDSWRLAQDPRTLAVGAPAVSQMMAAAVCPVVFSRGEFDEMVSTASLEALGDTRVISGVGHNAMVEDPAEVAALVGG